MRLKLSDLTQVKTRTIYKHGLRGPIPDYEEEFVIKVPVRIAHLGIRIAHYYIDAFAVSLISLGLFAVASIASDNNSPFASEITLNILFFLLMLAYYIFMEGHYQQTIGKMITGCVVVDEYGDKPGFKKAFYRTLCRFIPFDQLSFFNGRGWHDSIPKTYVMKKRDLEATLALLAEQEDGEKVHLYRAFVDENQE